MDESEGKKRTIRRYLERILNLFEEPSVTWF
jgi:hypothetical protein